MIKFKNPISFDVITDWDDLTGAVLQTQKVNYKQNEELDAEIIHYAGKWADLGYSNGWVAIGVDSELIEEIID